MFYLDLEWTDVNPALNKIKEGMFDRDDEQDVREIKILGLSTSNQRCHEIRLGAKKSLPLIWISVNVDAFDVLEKRKSVNK